MNRLCFRRKRPSPRGGLYRTPSKFAGRLFARSGAKGGRRRVEIPDQPVALDLLDTDLSTGRSCHGWVASGSSGPSGRLIQNTRWCRRQMTAHLIRDGLRLQTLAFWGSSLGQESTFKTRPTSAANKDRAYQQGLVVPFAATLRVP